MKGTLHNDSQCSISKEILMKRAIGLSVSVVFAVLCVSVTPASHAASIAFNFAENAANQVFAGGAPIGPTDLDSSFWNSSIDRDLGTLAAGTKASLIDSLGSATSAAVSWSSSNVWYNGDGVSTDEKKLAVGYLDDGGSGASFSLASIPYPIYDVYVLFTSDNNGDYQHTDITVAGTPVFGGNFNAHGRVTDGTDWVESDGVAFGNYIKIDRLTSDTLIVSAGPRNGSIRGPITGFVIVGMPEPSTLVLAALGLLSLGFVGRRRRRRA